MSPHLLERHVGRRHFLQHVAGAAALAGPATTFTGVLRAAAPDMVRRQKSVILLWMNGGPSTIDIWDLKTDSPTGGPFRPISTSGDVQICEHLPLMAAQMHHLTVVRSMNTSEADHNRGRYYMQTGFVPSPTEQHPSYGAVVSRELMAAGGRDLEIPPFVAIGGNSIGPGFLGMTYAPFVVSPTGNIDHLRPQWPETGGVRPNDSQRHLRRIAMLDVLEQRFIGERRGQAAVDHQELLRKTWELMSGAQLSAFQLSREPQSVRQRYGTTSFGNGCLLARRLTEAGVPFVEVDFGGWDTHQNNFATLQNKLPEMDQAMGALIEDLNQRGRLRDTAIVWMGEFGRTPRINGNSGRDHWARSWSVVVGGAGFRGGTVIGTTSTDGSEVESQPYKAEDLMASVLAAIDVSLDTVHHSRSGRPLKIANGGRIIEGILQNQPA